MEDQWRLRAACAGVDVNVFFPVRGDVQGHREALAWCSACPVKAQCRDDALRDELEHGWASGVRGGLSARKRREMLRWFGLCPECGLVFERPKNTQRYCSGECRAVAERKRKTAHEMQKRYAS